MPLHLSMLIVFDQILPYINSFNHIKKIAIESEVDINVVKICIQHLVYVVYFSTKLIIIMFILSIS